MAAATVSPAWRCATILTTVALLVLCNQIGTTAANGDGPGGSGGWAGYGGDGRNQHQTGGEGGWGGNGGNGGHGGHDYSGGQGCPLGYKDCNYNWRDGCETNVQSDVNNCGNCGLKCDASYPYTTPVCNSGMCESVCNPGWKDCNYRKQDGCEVNVDMDVNNCGACGVKCPAGSKCNNGNCESVCSPGYKDCNMKTGDGCEVNVNTDANNCGSCGAQCPSYPYCSAQCNGGKCQSVCNPGWKDCNSKLEDGCEVNANTDVNNCGACGVKCPPGYKCNNGRCESVCSAGVVDVNSDVDNCGNCGTKCVAYPYSVAKCNAGKCESNCNPGWKDCNNKKEDGCETDVGKDVTNCGTCGLKCPAYPYSNPTCSSGICGFVCQTGWKDCNNKKEDGCEVSVKNDVLNCGACGNKCPYPQDPNAQSTCSNGVCGSQCKSGFNYDNQTNKCVTSNYH